MTLSTRGLVLNGAGESSARPWRLAALTIALVMLAGCAGGDGEGPPPPATPTHETVLGSPEEYAAALVEETNRARTALGLPAMSVSECAAEQGAVRARALADAGEELEHAPLGPVTQACQPAAMAGENLSRASLGPEAVVDAWMGSPGHRENIVTPEFTEVGVSCVVSDGAGGEQMLCSQIFLGELTPG
ncbi:CAP domain-containing protein [Sanguibacter suarezii]|uniref:CAP domain-containing protein n=1 Tax=Sanguibacter suarezii TaxID=60921 RepID=UPI000835E7E0|nr:CAP domain-containing protein [Sanguibacter suarezii]